MFNLSYENRCESRRVFFLLSLATFDESLVDERVLTSFGCYKQQQQKKCIQIQLFHTGHKNQIDHFSFRFLLIENWLVVELCMHLPNIMKCIDNWAATRTSDFSRIFSEINATTVNGNKVRKTTRKTYVWPSNVQTMKKCKHFYFIFCFVFNCDHWDLCACLDIICLSLCLFSHSVFCRTFLPYSFWSVGSLLTT